MTERHVIPHNRHRYLIELYICIALQVHVSKGKNLSKNVFSINMHHSIQTVSSTCGLYVRMQLDSFLHLLQAILWHSTRSILPVESNQYITASNIVQSLYSIQRYTKTLLNGCHHLSRFARISDISMASIHSTNSDLLTDGLTRPK